MKKYMIYITEEILQDLKAKSADTGAPIAELIRRAIAAYLKTKEEGK